MTCDSTTGAPSIAKLCSWIALDGPHTNHLSDAEMVDLAYRLLLQAEARIRGKQDRCPDLDRRLEGQQEADAVLDAALRAQDALTVMRDHGRPAHPSLSQRQRESAEQQAVDAHEPTVMGHDAALHGLREAG